MYMWPIPNGFRGRLIWLHSCEEVDKKELLRTISNIGIHYSSDKVGKVYLAQYIFEIPPSISMHFATRVRTWRVARLYSVLYIELALSRKRLEYDTCTYIFFWLERPILWLPRTLIFLPGTLYKPGSSELYLSFRISFHNFVRTCIFSIFSTYTDRDVLFLLRWGVQIITLHIM
jgi:hypothetical protein